MEQMFTFVGSLFSMIPFSAATWFVLLNMAFFVWLFAKADQRSDSPVHWEHLVVDSQNNRASPYKVGYLIGVIVSTWIVIKISDAGNLSLDIFGAYLAYLVTGAGVNSYTKVKEYGGSTHSRPDVDYLNNSPGGDPYGPQPHGDQSYPEHRGSRYREPYPPDEQYPEEHSRRP